MTLHTIQITDEFTSDEECEELICIFDARFTSMSTVYMVKKITN